MVGVGGFRVSGFLLSLTRLAGVLNRVRPLLSGECAPESLPVRLGTVCVPPHLLAWSALGSRTVTFTKWEKGLIAERYVFAE